jgi:hypothetical protein
MEYGFDTLIRNSRCSTWALRYDVSQDSGRTTDFNILGVEKTTKCRRGKISLNNDVSRFGWALKADSSYTCRCLVYGSFYCGSVLCCRAVAHAFTSTGQILGQCPQWVEWSGVSPFSTPLHTNWSGVEWSRVLLHGLHGVVAKGVTKWCQFWRCIDRELHIV